MQKLKMAIQKEGRLSEKSLQLLRDCGIKVNNGQRTLKASASNFPIDLLFLRDDDIPQYVADGVADVGILGQNEVWEKGKSVEEIQTLGFAHCRMALALPKAVQYSDLSWFAGKRIATSYPNILRNFFNAQGIEVRIEEIGGSVEIAPSIGLSDAIFDIVSTGSTLMMNGLYEVATVCESQATLIAQPQLSEDKQAIVEQLLFRIQSVQRAKENKYILLNAPNDKIATITQLLPGLKSPTLLPLQQEGWSSLHSVIREDDFWENIDRLKAAGAEGILIIPVEKMIL